MRGWFSTHMLSTKKIINKQHETYGKISVCCKYNKQHNRRVASTMGNEARWWGWQQCPKELKIDWETRKDLWSVH